MNDYKEYPDVPDFRAEADSVCLKIKFWVAQEMHKQTLAELDYLTDVHQFDRDDKSTWPKEGVLFLLLTRDTVCINPIIITEYSNKMLAKYQDRYWSYSAPALQAKLKSLSETT